MPEQKKVVQFFMEASMADEPIKNLDGTTNGFVVELLMETWPEFQEVAQKSKIKSVDFEKFRSVTDFGRFSVTFSTDQVLSAIIKTAYSKLLADQLPSDFKENHVNACLKTFNREAEFYKLFSGANGSNIPGFPLPKIYYIGNDGSRVGEDQDQPLPMLIMEDLKKTSDDSVEADNLLSTKPFDGDQQMKSIAIHLANFHAHLLCMENENWKSGFESKHKTSGKDEILMEMKLYKEKGMGPLTELVKRLQKAVDAFFLKHDFDESQSGLPEVLVHGDLHQGNVIFLKADPSLVHAFIDFGCISLGSITFDLARIASVGTRKKACGNLELARKVDSDILALYYETLSRKMTEAGHELNFTLKQLQRSFRACLVHAAIRMLVGCYSIVNGSCGTNPPPANLDAKTIADKIAQAKLRTDSYMEMCRNATLEAIQILEEDA